MDKTLGRRLRFAHAQRGRQFGKSGGGSVPPPPAAPDPIAQANAEANINRYNIVSPFGTQTWTPPGAGAQSAPLSFDAWKQQTYPGGVPTTDPNAGKRGLGRDYYPDESNFVPQDVRPSYDAYVQGFTPSATSGSPQWTQTTTLDASQQRQFDERNKIAESLLGRAQTQLPQIPSDPLKFAPQNASISDFAKRIASMSDNPFAPSVNGAAVRDATYKKLTGLLDPHFDREEVRLDQKLSNQGLPMGSEAFGKDFGDFGRARDTSYERAALDAVLAGAGEEQNQFMRDLSTRQQQGAELQAGQGAALTADQDERARVLAERQQMFNELAALLGGQQLNTINPSGGAVDVGGAFAREQAGKNAAYQAQVAQSNQRTASDNSLMSGLFGLGSAAVPFLF